MGDRLRATGTPEKDVQPLAELLAEDLAEWPSDAWVVFDDYQFACESPFAERFVELVLGLCPLRLFLTSRKRPTWAKSKLLLYGEAYEIGRSLLAMSHEEAEQVLSHRAGSEVRGSGRTCRWLACRDRAGCTCRRLRRPRRRCTRGALRVLRRRALPGSGSRSPVACVRNSRLSSAVAPSVAEALLGDEAERAVRECRRLGFLISSEQGLYEIHPLLRGFLEIKFRELAGDQAAEIVERLVRAHIGREDWDDGFSLVERFFDRDLLVELFEAALPAMLLGSAPPDPRSVGRMRSRERRRCPRRRSRRRRARVPRRRADAVRGSRLCKRRGASATTTR